MSGVGDKGALSWGDTAAQGVSRRIYGSVANEAELETIGPEQRADGMVAVVMTGHALWVFDAASSEAAAAGSVRVPANGTGRWHKAS